MVLSSIWISYSGSISFGCWYVLNRSRKRCSVIDGLLVPASCEVWLRRSIINTLDSPSRTPPTNELLIAIPFITRYILSTHSWIIFYLNNSTTAEIPLSEVLVSQLVAYDSEKDLLPVMLANCSYSLEVGKETSSQYNWEALQKQIIDRFIRGRPTVEFQVTISSIRGKKNSLSKRQNYTILDVLRKFANKSFKAVNGNLTFQSSLAFSLK